MTGHLQTENTLCCPSVYKCDQSNIVHERWHMMWDTLGGCQGYMPSHVMCCTYKQLSYSSCYSFVFCSHKLQDFLFKCTVNSLISIFVRNSQFTHQPSFNKTKTSFPYKLEYDYSLHAGCKSRSQRSTTSYPGHGSCRQTMGYCRTMPKTCVPRKRQKRSSSNQPMERRVMGQ